LNKKSRRADKGWSSSLGLGKGLTIPHHKIHLVTRFYTDLHMWMDSLDQPKIWKLDMGNCGLDLSGPG